MKISNWAKLDLLLLACRRQITPEGISVFDDDQWVQCSEKYIRRDVNFRVFGESKHYTRTPNTMAIICLRVWVVHTPRGTSAKTGNMLLACIMLL